MKNFLLLGTALISLSSCGKHTQTNVHSALTGSWRLLSSISVAGQDTTDTSPAQGTETIKLYNDDHFAFFTHDRRKGRTRTAAYDSGAGTFQLAGDKYTEHLEYCSERQWEDHTFSFTMKLSKDTFVQRGLEKIDSLHIDHVIIETYARMR